MDGTPVSPFSEVVSSVLLKAISLHGNLVVGCQCALNLAFPFRQESSFSWLFCLNEQTQALIERAKVCYLKGKK